MDSMSYFLGANTSVGFYSLFNQLYNPEKNNKIYLIKGGPGTGKSSIMKHIASAAEKKGLSVHRIPCSSDPSSLDAIIIPELNISFADATSPHIINPVYPGICEHTIDLSQFWNKNKLSVNSDIIKKITKENSNAHKKCIRFMKAASIVNEELFDILSKIYDSEKIKRFTTRFINTEISDIKKGECRKAFLSAVSPSGIVVQYDTLFSCNKIFTINDKFGYITNIITSIINKYCEFNNISRINYLCPLNPEKIDHIMFNNKIALFSADTYHPMIKKTGNTINSERFLLKDEYIKVRNRLNFLNKTKLELINESIRCLEEAKALHDILEGYYMAAMDFSKVSEITDNLIKELII